MKIIFLKIYQILTPANRKMTLILLGLIIVGTFFEILGIGLLLPVISILIENNLATKYPVIEPLLIALGSPSHERQIQILMFLLVIIFTVKNLYLTFLAWWQARFSVGLQVELSQRFFTLYLNQPYNFHLQRNSAELIRNITAEVGTFIGYTINPLIMLTAELLILLSIVALLLKVEPFGSLLIFLVISVAAGLFYRITHFRIARSGVLHKVY